MVWRVARRCMMDIGHRPVKGAMERGREAFHGEAIAGAARGALGVLGVWQRVGGVVCERGVPGRGR